MSLLIPTDLITRTVADSAPPAAQSGATVAKSPEENALSHLVQKGDQATLGVTVGGKAKVLGMDASAQASASVSATYNGDGTYDVTLTESQQAGVSAQTGGDEGAPESSTKKSVFGTLGRIFLGPEGDDPPSTEPVPQNPGVVPVPGTGGVTLVPQFGASGQTKPTEKGEGEGSGGVGTQEGVTPGESSEQTSPSLSAQTGINTTYSVTVHVTGKQEAERAMQAFTQMAQSPRPGSFVNNPIMDQINGKSGSVPDVSPSTLDFLQKNVSTYSESVTGSGSAVAGLDTSFGNDNLSKLNVSLQGSEQVSMSRTVTTPLDGTQATVAYQVSGQGSAQPTASLFNTPLGAQSNEQVSLTQTFNLNGSSEVADPEGALTAQGRWLEPNSIQQQIQTQTQVGGPADGILLGSSTVKTNTITATTTYNRDFSTSGPSSALESAAQTFQANRTHPGTKQQPPNFSVTDTQSTTQNSIISVGSSDSPISATATLSQPIYV